MSKKLIRVIATSFAGGGLTLFILLLLVPSAGMLGLIGALLSGMVVGYICADIKQFFVRMKNMFFSIISWRPYPGSTTSAIKIGYIVSGIFGVFMYGVLLIGELGNLLIRILKYIFPEYLVHVNFHLSQVEGWFNIFISGLFFQAILFVVLFLFLLPETTYRQKKYLGVFLSSKKINSPVEYLLHLAPIKLINYLCIALYYLIEIRFDKVVYTKVVDCFMFVNSDIKMICAVNVPFGAITTYTILRVVYGELNIFEIDQYYLLTYIFAGGLFSAMLSYLSYKIIAIKWLGLKPKTTFIS